MTKVELFRFFRSISLKAFYAGEAVVNLAVSMGHVTQTETHICTRKRFKPKSKFIPGAKGNTCAECAESVWVGGRLHACERVSVCVYFCSNLINV